ncbi:MAG: DUF1616 domain-containing protein [Dehalococcoidales bacterium]|jgi:uncharacterized membrane protein
MDLSPVYAMTFSEPLQILRAVGGGILVFFVPGFAWTLVIFKKIHLLERIALSIGFSIALITLSLVVLNIIFDLDINLTNSLITIAVLTVIPGGIYLFQRYRRRGPKIPGGE